MNLHEEITNELKNLNQLIVKYRNEKFEDHYAINYKKIVDYLDYNRLSNFFKTLNLLDTNKIGVSSKDIVDIGSYFPYFLYLISLKYTDCTLTSYELNENALKFGRHILPEGNFIHSDFFGINKIKHETDIIFCTQVFEHLVRPDIALKKLLEIKGGGYLIITIPDGRLDNYQAGEILPAKTGYVGHINFWSLESWAIFLEINCSNYKTNIKSGKLSENIIYAIIEKI